MTIVQTHFKIQCNLNLWITMDNLVEFNTKL